jgi:2'-hydroxyisoflavone reductase
MQILIIGGGIFVGRALIEAALAQGHQVTAFSRGILLCPEPTRSNLSSAIATKISAH